MRKLTKQQVLTHWRKYHLPKLCKIETNGPDIPGRRLDFQIYVDHLHRDDRITEQLRTSIDIPKLYETLCV